MTEGNVFTNHNTEGILIKYEEIKKSIEDHMVHWKQLFQLYGGGRNCLLRENIIKNEKNALLLQKSNFLEQRIFNTISGKNYEIIKDKYTLPRGNGE